MCRIQAVNSLVKQAMRTARIEGVVQYATVFKVEYDTYAVLAASGAGSAGTGAGGAQAGSVHRPAPLFSPPKPTREQCIHTVRQLLHSTGIKYSLNSDKFRASLKHVFEDVGLGKKDGAFRSMVCTYCQRWSVPWGVQLTIAIDLLYVSCGRARCSIHHREHKWRQGQVAWPVWLRRWRTS